MNQLLQIVRKNRVRKVSLERGKIIATPGKDHCNYLPNSLSQVNSLNAPPMHKSSGLLHAGTAPRCRTRTPEISSSHEETAPEQAGQGAQVYPRRGSGPARTSRGKQTRSWQVGNAAPRRGSDRHSACCCRALSAWAAGAVRCVRSPSCTPPNPERGARSR